MKTTIDPKSVFVGLIVGIGVMFLMGFDSNTGEVGRYQISYSPVMGGGAVITLVDTKTGEIWAHGAGTEGMGAPKEQNFWNKK